MLIDHWLSSLDGCNEYKLPRAGWSHTEDNDVYPGDESGRRIYTMPLTAYNAVIRIIDGMDTGLWCMHTTNILW